MRYKYAFLIFLFVYCGDNHIIQRAAEDYFPLREGHWWEYTNQNDTILVEVEPLDTILQIQCFPVSYGGTVKYLAKHDESVSQYFITLYNFAGIDYTVLEDFIIRIELPLVRGNSYRQVLTDSILVAGQLIRADYEVIGDVIAFAYEPAYGDVYELHITTIQTLVTPDTTHADTAEVTEYYAPGVGMIRFRDASGEYHLIEYNIP